MRRRAAVIQLSDDEANTLREWTRPGESEGAALVERARIILLANEGRTNAQIAAELGTRAARVSKWRQRFGTDRLPGLDDAPRSGKPAKYGSATARRVLELLDQPPPRGYSGWNGNLLSEALPGVSTYQVWRILRRHGISLERRRSWSVATGPEFGPKTADLVGLYLNPPENALVLATGEKLFTQALKPAPGLLRAPDGRSAKAFSHSDAGCRRATLLAALEVASGLVKAAHYPRPRGREFADFMHEIVEAHPGSEIHVVLDHLDNGKPKEERWRKRRPGVHFHFVPAHSSWLDLVDCWFSIFSLERARDGALLPPGRLRRALDAFVQVYNPKAAPFEWKKTACI